MKDCLQAGKDFEKAANLKPQWAEPYNLAAGVYADCPDPAYRDPEKAIALIEHAIALDVVHPTYLTILALAYFRSGKLEQAVVTQRQALESPSFPPAYRDEATRQLHEYEAALASRNRENPEVQPRCHSLDAPGCHDPVQNQSEPSTGGNRLPWSARETRPLDVAGPIQNLHALP
jgi:cytochrome c-type biogenesis protein CcmH/NrfG